ncbi:RagB/SusD family nutrient uptake outer membrane protein [Mucilaginibacter gossypii]|uniref:RagB/SusD family nutrient uptake outer membrane protein n=1 Tax=Mucilaginibacter gossypii TaxID=551996 RepID=UPI000DCCB648|nr:MULTISPECIES: RagB/SusD family nutrient uptake outer membrane protein [Mucilaginibacter]QTE38621.1 RagB/SusD family nutrient uptake outer membrane protein [Mucilaginibacter gossypii]RAV55305.1 RagB/SusD family nutrient uptake outer membrane protein [Mucilaginibacter rubeus]
MNHIKKFYGLALIAVLLSALAGCKKDLLSVTPKNQLSDATVFGTESNADIFLNNVYTDLPHLNNETELLDQFSDNSYVGAEWFDARQMIYTGAIAPNNMPVGPWGMWRWARGTNSNNDGAGNYEFIRACNLFIQKVTASNFSADFKKQKLAEARFLRAFFYQYLYIAYGGVPIITDVLNNTTQGDEIYRPRNTSAETVKFITDELTAAAADLPLTTSEYGRATKGAALTLKAWVQLYDASPLHNSGTADAVGDAGKWAQAAAAYKQVMDLGVYSLLNDFGAVWLPASNNSPESIFAMQMTGAQNGGGRREGLYGPVVVHGAVETWGNFEPTQELVDEFSMDNGKAINEPGSGYNPQNPYVKREKRFYQSIVYDGAPWQGDTIYTRVGIGSPNEIDLNSTRGDISNTGYYARKTLDESIKGNDNLNCSCGLENYMFFRYAEVLLGYAEAQNEAVGPDASVLDAVNKVRTRGGNLPTVQATYGNVSQQQMRQIIHRERRVEFAFEDKRWWDVLRWKIASKVLNGPTHGMLITKKNGVWNYDPTAVVVTKQWNDKMYFMPVPQVAIDKNPKMKAQNGGPDNWVNGQNPGY